MRAQQFVEGIDIQRSLPWHEHCFAWACMNVSLYQAAAAMTANSRWQDIISENLAGSSVPGYRKQQISLEAVKAGLMPAGSAKGGAQFFVIPKTAAVTSFQPGEIQPTGNKTDAALEGKGFFSIQLPNGKTALTRDGEFQVNSTGQLVTKEGYTVLGDGGAIKVDAKSPAPFSISTNGTVSQGSEVKGKLKLVDYADPKLLTPLSGSYFTAEGTSAKEQPAAATVRQGYLEGSNTSTVREMSNLLTAMRTFEANQKIIQMQDERLGKAISELGNPT